MFHSPLCNGSFRAVFATVAGSFLCSYALSETTVPAVRTAHAPAIDGLFRAADWKNAPRIRQDAETFTIEYDDAFVYLLAEGLPRGANRLSLVLAPAKDKAAEVAIGATTLGVLINVADLLDSTTIESRIPWTLLNATPSELVSARVEISQPRSSVRPVRFLWGGFGVPAQPGTLHVEPYVLGSANTANNGYLNAGVDRLETKYRGLDLLGAINPDFRTIERGILSLDFSYFERLAPETRPFFLQGGQFYSGSFFASQRIGEFNAGGKVFGALDKHTSVGLLETANFWDENEFVGTVSHQFDQNGSAYVGFKNYHNLGLSNEFISGGGAYKIGPFRINSDVQMTHDNQLGSGDSLDAQLSYDRNGVFGRLTGISTSTNFFDSLGYFIEPGVKGINATIGGYRPYNKGALFGSALTLSTSQFRYQNNLPYRNYIGGTGELTFRNGFDFQTNYTSGRFLTNQDHYAEFIASEPIRGGKARVGVDYTVGRLASSDYNNVLFFVSYRPSPRFYVSGSFQTVKQFTDEDQTILNFSYDVGKGQTLGGRLVQFQNDWNFYLRFSKAAKTGVVYEVLIGDPNAPKFQKALFLKMTFPMTLKF